MSPNDNVKDCTNKTRRTSKKKEEEGSSRRRYNDDNNNNNDEDMDGRGKEGVEEGEG